MPPPRPPPRTVGVGAPKKKNKWKPKPKKAPPRKKPPPAKKWGKVRGAVNAASAFKGGKKKGGGGGGKKPGKQKIPAAFAAGKKRKKKPPQKPARGGGSGGSRQLCPCLMSCDITTFFCCCGKTAGGAGGAAAPAEHKSWARRNMVPLVLLIAAILAIVIAILISLEPCKPSTSSDFDKVEAVFASDASGSFITSFGAAAKATATFIEQLSKTLGDSKLLVAFAQWNDPSRSGGGFYTFVPASPSTSAQFPFLDQAKTRVTSGDIPAVLNTLKSPGLKSPDTIGGTQVGMAMFGCLEILMNSVNANSLKMCFVFTDAEWSDSTRNYRTTLGSDRFVALCDKHGIASCTVDGVKAFMESKGMLVILGWLDPTGQTQQCTNTGSRQYRNVVRAIGLSSCGSKLERDYYTSTSCDKPTQCTASTSDKSTLAGRCCPFWLELGNNDNLIKNADVLAKQIGDVARSGSSVCLKDTTFLWVLLLLIPFLLYCCLRPLFLCCRGVPEPEPTPPPRQKKKGPRDDVVLNYYGFGASGAPMACNWGHKHAETLPDHLEPTRLAITGPRFKGDTKLRRPHFDDFHGMGAKDFYGADGIEEGDLDDYILRCCCCCLHLLPENFCKDNCNYSCCDWGDDAPAADAKKGDIESGQA